MAGARSSIVGQGNHLVFAIDFARRNGRFTHPSRAALNPQLAIQVYELNSLDEQIQRVDPCSNGNLNTWLVPHREAELLKSRASEALAPIVAILAEAITAHAVSQEQEVVLRFRGLTFARWKDGQVYFGIGTTWEELSSASEKRLNQLIAQLQNYRNPLATNTRHIPSIARNPSVGCSRLELKASENPDLPLQAADYWARVRRHQAQGDLVRYGYFPGLELQPAPSIVYLVAPALRFHPTTSAILPYFSPEIEVIRVGVAESWRRGLRVMIRQ